MNARRDYYQVLGVPRHADANALPCYHGRGRGSLNITVIVDIPEQLSPRQRRLYEQLRSEGAQATGDSGLSA